MKDEKNKISGNKRKREERKQFYLKKKNSHIKLKSKKIAEDPNNEFKQLILSNDIMQDDYNYAKIDDTQNLEQSKILKNEINSLEQSHNHIFGRIGENKKTKVNKDKKFKSLKILNEYKPVNDKIKINSLLGKNILNFISLGEKSENNLDNLNNVKKAGQYKFYQKINNFKDLCKTYLKETKKINPPSDLENSEKFNNKIKVRFHFDNSTTFEKIKFNLNIPLRKSSKLIETEDDDEIFNEREESEIQIGKSIGHNSIQPSPIFQTSKTDEYNYNKYKDVNLSQLLKK